MTGMGRAAAVALRGQCILVVEDEYMIAEEIAEVLLEAGADMLGPVPRVSEAVDLIASGGRINGAVLDVNLFNELIWPVVDMLLPRAVPLLLATGYDVGAIPRAYAHLPRREKPVTGQELVRALAEVLALQHPVDD